MKRLRMQPKHPARRMIILDALAGCAFRADAVKEARRGWDAPIGLEVALEHRHGPPPSILDRLDVVYPGRPAELESWAAYARALRRARASWRSPPFVAGVTAVLRDVGFPATVAALLVPHLLCPFVEYGDRFPPCAWPSGKRDMRASRTPCPLRPPGPAVASVATNRRGPRRTTEYLEERAAWYFEVEVEGRQMQISRAPGRRARGFWTVGAVARRRHRQSNHAFTEYSANCGCRRTVQAGIRDVQTLLGLAPGRDP